MFKHLLLPTDGSELSMKAIHEGIAFAKTIGAKVTAFHVISEFRVFTYQAEMLEDTREQYEKDCMAHARKLLADIEAIAKEAGVKCDSFYEPSDQPYEAIVRAAHDKRCDLIAMASHGRKGVKGFLLGSETQKVLTHSEIPVLVFR